MIYVEPQTSALRAHQVGNRRPIEYAITESGCWECTSHATTEKGYVKLRRNNRHLQLHRYVYECENGTIPAEMYVMHKCDNPTCMNPSHLQIGTPADNMQDMVDKGRSARGTKNGGGVKLTESDVSAIRKDIRTLRTIAKDYGVAFSIIAKVKRKQLWSHVKE